MVRCFLTGVELPIEKALVLNRREANDLLNVLKDRVASLQRVIEQFSPLDDIADGGERRYLRQPGFARRKHRLVCKAVAEILAPGFSEIRLFLAWPEYRLQAHAVTQRTARRHREPHGTVETREDKG